LAVALCFELVINRKAILKLEGWQFCRPSFFTLVVLALAFSACEKVETAQPQVYEGPIREGENIEMFYSEKEKVTVKIKAKRVSEFQNGDRQFPESVFIEFYDELGAVSSTLSANSAFFYKEENKWKGVGNVEVKNMQKSEQLNTEELFWFPTKKKINTDKFVTIRTGKEVMYGTGLDAKQDMSEYKIQKVEGEFAIED
jgi:LPS export ABC transporter protein LptC